MFTQKRLNKKWHNYLSFTLIEILIAVSIFSIIAVVMYSSFRAGTVSLRRINSEIEAQQTLRYFFQTVTKDIKNMVSFTELPFEGDSQNLKFVSIGKSYGDIVPMMRSITYSLSTDSGYSSLQRKEVKVSDILKADESEETKLVESKEILIENITKLRFRYLSVQDSEAEGSFKYEWLEIWESIDKRPIAIEMQFSILDTLSGDEMEYSKKVFIPSAEL